MLLWRLNMLRRLCFESQRNSCMLYESKIIVNDCKHDGSRLPRVPILGMMAHLWSISEQRTELDSGGGQRPTALAVVTPAEAGDGISLPRIPRFALW
jgi:hypothetical protein